MGPRRAKIISLITIHIIVALNALAGGYYGLAGASGVPLEWLRGSPFTSYFYPSLILLLVVGGSQTAAAIAVIMKKSKAPNYSFFAGLILLIWIVVQVSVIGYVSWLQPAMAITAIVTIATARSL
jgi:hypothetical protein